MSELARHEGAPCPMGSGVCHRGTSIVWFSWLRSVGRLVRSLPVSRRWRCVRRQSSLRFLLLQRSLTTVHGGMPACTTSPSTRPITMRMGASLLLSPASSSSALRTRIALAQWCRANASAPPWPRQCQSCFRRLRQRHDVRRIWFIEHRRRSAPLHRWQSDWPWQLVVRPVHEHGVAAHRPSRHRI